MVNKIASDSSPPLAQEHVDPSTPEETTQYCEEPCPVCFERMLINDAMGHRWPESASGGKQIFSCHKVHKVCLLTALTNSEKCPGGCQTTVNKAGYDEARINVDPDLKKVFERIGRKESEESQLRAAGIALKFWRGPLYTNRWVIALFLVVVAVCSVCAMIPGSLLIVWVSAKTTGSLHILGIVLGEVIALSSSLAIFCHLASCVRLRPGLIATI
jgi:hypothetical protein